MFKISSYNNRFQLFSSLHPHPMHPSVGSPRRGSLHSLNTHRPDSGGRNGARSRWKTLAKTLRYHPFVTSAHVWTFSDPPTHPATHSPTSQSNMRMEQFSKIGTYEKILIISSFDSNPVAHFWVL